MNWLEIGCPYCPTVLTVPRATAGRTVRCPECGKSYLIPDPKQASASYEVTPPTTLPVSPAEGVFEELAAAVVSKPAASPPPAAAAPASPTSPQPPSHPSHKHTTAVNGPFASAEPPHAPFVALHNETAATAPPAVAEVPRVRRRSPAEDLMYPELERDSPLPELEILPPPGQRFQPSNKPAAAAASAPPQPTMGGDVSLPSYDPAPSHLMPGSGPPPGPSRSAAEEAAAMDEVQQRIRRHRARAMMNLAAFVIGVAVMTAFAFLVVRFSRPS